MSWLKRWLFTTNHKDVGILYIVTSLYFGFLGTALSLLIRTQLTFPGMEFLRASQYDQAVTLHGLVMVLWFLSPFAFGFANYFVPLQIGAKDMAFPRINAMSYWLYLFGGLLAALGFFVPGGAVAAGWTVYAPLSSLQFSPGLGTTLGGAGLLMLIGSVTMSTINFVTTIVKLRATGMSWSRIPMFTWFIFLTVIMMLLAFPAIFAAVIMLALDRIVGTIWFSSIAGGAVLWTNAFWFFGHPEVYIVLFPALGAISDIIPLFAQKPLYAKKGLMASGFIATVLSLIVYGHHMYLTPIILPAKEYFTVATELISLPFGFMIFCIIGTLYKARVRYTTPMLFALGAPIMFMIGGLTGVFNSSVALDQWFRGTYWVTGHFHLVMVGSTVFGLFGALYYWWPKMTGKMYNESLGKWHFWTMFIGFVVFSLAMHTLIDMPRRVFTYDASTGWGAANLIATAGALVTMLSQLIFILNMLSSAKGGVSAEVNPWGASTLEWSSPNIMAEGRLEQSLAGAPAITALVAGGILSSPSGLLARLHGTEVSMGERASTSDDITHFSSRPLFLSLGLFLLFLGVGLSILLLLVGVLVIAYCLVGWALDDLRGRFGVPESAGGESWPFGGIAKFKFGVWVFITSDVVFFSILFSSYAFVRFNSPTWPAPGGLHNITIGGINTIILLTSGLTAAMAVQSIVGGNQRGPLLWLTATALLGSTFLSVKATEWFELFRNGFTFSSGVSAASFYTITGAHAVHVAMGLLFLVYLIGKTLRGGFNKESYDAVEGFTLYWALVDIVWLIVFPLFYLT